MSSRNTIAFLTMAAWMLLAATSPGLAAAPGARDVPAGLAYPAAVIRYEPSYGDTCVPYNPNFTDPQVVLGPPDYTGGSNGTGALSLGSGGLLELLFVGTQIGNSGDSRVDLYVVEIGGFDEAFYFALRPVAPTTPADLLALGLQDQNGDGFFEFGWIAGGATTRIDLDAYFDLPVPELGVRFDAVQLIDDVLDHTTCTSTVGADIDAIEASQAYVAIEPATWTLVKTLYRY